MERGRGWFLLRQGPTAGNIQASSLFQISGIEECTVMFIPDVVLSGAPVWSAIVSEENMDDFGFQPPAQNSGYPVADVEDTEHRGFNVSGCDTLETNSVSLDDATTCALKSHMDHQSEVVSGDGDGQSGCVAGDQWQRDIDRCHQQFRHEAALKSCGLPRTALSMKMRMRMRMRTAAMGHASRFIPPLPTTVPTAKISSSREAQRAYNEVPPGSAASQSNRPSPSRPDLLLVYKGESA